MAHCGVQDLGLVLDSPHFISICHVMAMLQSVASLPARVQSPQQPLMDMQP